MKSHFKGLGIYLLLCFFVLHGIKHAQASTSFLPVSPDSVKYPISIPDNWVNEIKACNKLSLSKELIRGISSLTNPEYTDTIKYIAKAGQWEEANLDNDPESEIIVFTGMKDRVNGYNRLYILKKQGKQWQISGSIIFIRNFHSVSDLPAFHIAEANKFIVLENSLSWGQDGYSHVEKQFYTMLNGRPQNVLNILLNTYQANGYEYIGGSSSDTLKVNGTIKVVYSYWINVFNKFFPEDLLPDRYKSDEYMPIDIFDNNFIVDYKWNNDSLKYLPDYKGDRALQAKTEYIGQINKYLAKPHSPFIEDIRREAKKGNDLQKYYVNKRGY